MNLLRMNALLLANRQSPHDFSMSKWHCGTYACLMGNYALRPDLQSSFALEPIPDRQQKNLVWCDGETPTVVMFSHGIWSSIATHFEIAITEAIDLFAPEGCDEAGEDREAALAYIEAFIADKLAEAVPEPEVEPEEIAA